MNETSSKNTDQLANPRRIFTFLILYRWLSLIPPLLTLLLAKQKALPLLILMIAIGINGLISLFPKQLNQALRSQPLLLAVDLALVAALIAFTDGWHSPYYLYALNPLLAAAYFCRTSSTNLMMMTVRILYFEIYDRQ